MDQMPHDLILVSFPHQLLHAIGALRMERLHRGIAIDDPVTVLVWSYQPGEHLERSRFRRLIPQMLKGVPEARLNFPRYGARQLALSSHRSITDRARHLATCIIPQALRMVAYSHDVSADHTAQALLQAASPASAICFGDPPGFLYSSDQVRQSAAYKPSLMRTLFGHRRSSDASLDWKFADANWVAVDFPGDSGQAIARSTGIIAPEVLKHTLQQLSRGIEQRAALQQRILALLPEQGQVRLLVLSNFTESGLTSSDQELALYGELIKRHAHPGVRVLIKPHAGTTPAFARRLVDAVPGYQVEILPQELGVLPVEMLDGLLERCEVISVSSASALLASLHGLEGISHGLTDELIARHFSPAWVSGFQASNRSILKAMNAVSSQAVQPPGA